MFDEMGNSMRRTRASGLIVRRCQTNAMRGDSLAHGWSRGEEVPLQPGSCKGDGDMDIGEHDLGWEKGKTALTKEQCAKCHRKRSRSRWDEFGIRGGAIASASSDDA